MKKTCNSNNNNLVIFDSVSKLNIVKCLQAPGVIMALGLPFIGYVILNMWLPIFFTTEALWTSKD